MMLMRAQRDENAGRKRQAYEPPIEWRIVPVRDLLRGSPREEIGSTQLDMLSSSTEGLPGSGATLFVAGDTDLLKKRCISVIGTRAVSPEGRKRARRLARELAERHVVVVSGLADGVDAEAMTAAIGSGGQTVGVIGTPLDKAYPAKNARLQEIVYREHLLISQFREGQRVFPSNFPERNRTMALLSDASVVIEASDSSGTLHQAAECVRLKRWLCIAKNVVDDPRLSWPAKFLTYDRCIVLRDTDELLERIYSGGA